VKDEISSPRLHGNTRLSFGHRYPHLFHAYQKVRFVTARDPHYTFLLIQSVLCRAPSPITMSPIPTLGMPSEAALQFLRNELKGNAFQGVDGFFAKYFEARSWSAAVQKKMQKTESAEIVSKLSADVLSLTHFDALVEWLATFQSLIFAPDQVSFGLNSQSISKPDCPFKVSIYLETSDVQAFAGSTRVFGEYHHSDASVIAEDDGDFLDFCERARQVFKT
jgi:hypothetical protein